MADRVQRRPHTFTAIPEATQQANAKKLAGEAAARKAGATALPSIKAASMFVPPRETRSSLERPSSSTPSARSRLAQRTQRLHIIDDSVPMSTKKTVTLTSWFDRFVAALSRLFSRAKQPEVVIKPKKDTVTLSKMSNKKFLEHLGKYRAVSHFNSSWINEDFLKEKGVRGLLELFVETQDKMLETTSICDQLKNKWNEFQGKKMQAFVQGKVGKQANLPSELVNNRAFFQALATPYKKQGIAYTAFERAREILSTHMRENSPLTQEEKQAIRDAYAIFKRPS